MGVKGLRKLLNAIPGSLDCIPTPFFLDGRVLGWVCRRRGVDALLVDFNSITFATVNRTIHEIIKDDPLLADAAGIPTPQGDPPVFGPVPPLNIYQERVADTAWRMFSEIVTTCAAWCPNMVMAVLVDGRLRPLPKWEECVARDKRAAAARKAAWEEEMNKSKRTTPDDATGDSKMEENDVRQPALEPVRDDADLDLLPLFILGLLAPSAQDLVDADARGANILTAYPEVVLVDSGTDADSAVAYATRRSAYAFDPPLLFRLDNKRPLNVDELASLLHQLQSPTLSTLSLDGDWALSTTAASVPFAISFTRSKGAPQLHVVNKRILAAGLGVSADGPGLGNLTLYLHHEFLPKATNGVGPISIALQSDFLQPHLNYNWSVAVSADMAMREGLVGIWREWQEVFRQLGWSLDASLDEWAGVLRIIHGEELVTGFDRRASRLVGWNESFKEQDVEMSEPTFHNIRLESAIKEPFDATCKPYLPIGHPERAQEQRAPRKRSARVFFDTTLTRYRSLAHVQNPLIYIENLQPVANPPVPTPQQPSARQQHLPPAQPQSAAAARRATQRASQPAKRAPALADHLAKTTIPADLVASARHPLVPTFFDTIRVLFHYITPVLINVVLPNIVHARLSCSPTSEGALALFDDSQTLADIFDRSLVYLGEATSWQGTNNSTAQVLYSAHPRLPASWRVEAWYEHDITKRERIQQSRLELSDCEVLDQVQQVLRIPKAVRDLLALPSSRSLLEPTMTKFAASYALADTQRLEASLRTLVGTFLDKPREALRYLLKFSDSLQAVLPPRQVQQPNTARLQTDRDLLAAQLTAPNHLIDVLPALAATLTPPERQRFIGLLARHLLHAPSAVGKRGNDGRTKLSARFALAAAQIVGAVPSFLEMDGDEAGSTSRAICGCLCAMLSVALNSAAAVDAGLTYDASVKPATVGKGAASLWQDERHAGIAVEVARYEAWEVHQGRRASRKVRDEQTGWSAVARAQAIEEALGKGGQALKVNSGGGAEDDGGEGDDDWEDEIEVDGFDTTVHASIAAAIASRTRGYLSPRACKFVLHWSRMVDTFDSSAGTFDPSAEDLGSLTRRAYSPSTSIVFSPQFQTTCVTESSTFLWETVYGKQRGVVQQAYDAMTDFIPRLLGGVYSHATPAIKRRLRQLRDDAKLATTSVQAALGGVDLSTGLRPLIDDTATALNLAKGAATSTSAFRDAVVGQRILVASKFFKLDERYLPQGWMQTTRRRVNMLMLDLTKPSQRLIDYVYARPTSQAPSTSASAASSTAPTSNLAAGASLPQSTAAGDFFKRVRENPKAGEMLRSLCAVSSGTGTAAVTCSPPFFQSDGTLPLRLAQRPVELHPIPLPRKPVCKADASRRR